MTNNINIKVNKLIPGFTVDQVVSVACDENGTPLDFHWRRKLKDARLDNCCEVVKDVKIKTVKSGVTESEVK